MMMSPGTSGRSRSVRRRSKASLATRSSASRPLAAVFTWAPSMVSSLAKVSRRFASSSTRRLRAPSRPCFVLISLIGPVEGTQGQYQASPHGTKRGEYRATTPRLLGNRRGGGSGARRRIGERDLRLAPRHLALDLPPDLHGYEGRAVVGGAALQLVHEGARVVHAAARRLGHAANVVVAGALGFHPGLLEVRHHQHHLIDLAIEVVPPLRGGGEATAVALHHGREVLRDVLDLAHVVLDARQRLRGGEVRRGVRRGGEDEGDPDGEPRGLHRSSIRRRGGRSTNDDRQSPRGRRRAGDRKSTRLNSSHVAISY